MAEPYFDPATFNSKDPAEWKNYKPYAAEVTRAISDMPFVLSGAKLYNAGGLPPGSDRLGNEPDPQAIWNTIYRSGFGGLGGGGAVDNSSLAALLGLINGGGGATDALLGGAGGLGMGASFSGGDLGYQGGGGGGLTTMQNGKVVQF